MKKTTPLLAMAFAALIGTTGIQQGEARPLEQGDGFAGKQFLRQLDQANQADREKFLAATKDLRKQIEMKRAEQAALLRSTAPDREAVRKTAGELFDLRTALHDKAKAAGLFPPANQADKDDRLAAKRAKIEQFLAETKEIRRQIAIYHAEKQALMHSRVPDATAISQVTGKLFDAKTALQKKADDMGLPRHAREHGKHHVLKTGPAA